MKYWANLLWALLAVQAAVAAPPANPMVELHTSQGIIVLELDYKKAPKTVENFLGYARDGFYNGTVFHRVIPDYLIQGGGYTADYEKKPTREPVQNEASNGLKNKKGSVAMSRGSDPHSATSQFFINLADNAALDAKGSSAGYTVFGKVKTGMDVAETIQDVETGEAGPFSRNAPVEPVILEKVVIQRDLPGMAASSPPPAEVAPEPAEGTPEASADSVPEETAEDTAETVESAPEAAETVENTAAADTPKANAPAPVTDEYAPELPDVPAVE